MRPSLVGNGASEMSQKRPLRRWQNLILGDRLYRTTNENGGPVRNRRSALLSKGIVKLTGMGRISPPSSFELGRNDSLARALPNPEPAATDPLSVPQPLNLTMP